MGRDTIDDRVACLEAGADDYSSHRSEDFFEAGAPIHSQILVEQSSYGLVIWF